MNSEYERIRNILGEERSEALDKGAWAEKNAQIEAVKHLTDEQLKEIIGDVSKEDINKWRELKQKMLSLKTEAKMELMWRPIAKRATEALNKPGSSGFFCVAHDCDGNECPEGSHE